MKGYNFDDENHGDNDDDDDDGDDDDNDDDHNEAVGTLSEQLTIGGTGAETPLAEFERTTCACALSTVGVMMMCAMVFMMSTMSTMGVMVMSTMMVTMSTMGIMATAMMILMTTAGYLMLGPIYKTIHFFSILPIMIGVGNSDGNDEHFGINFL